MGKLVWAVGLDRLGEAGAPERVKEALWSALVSQWNDVLGSGASTRTAVDWLDDVITFELDDSGFTLLFNLSVGWPVDRGEHWVRVGLALGRHGLDADLAAAGYRIRQRGDAAPFPSTKSELYGRKPRCTCELCSSILDNFALYAVNGYAGHTGEALDRRVTDTTWTYVPSLAGDGNALWLSADPPRVYVTWDAGERWERVVTAEPLTERLRAVALSPGRFLLASDAWHRSDDGGMSWQVLAAPAGECTELHARGDDVLAIVTSELHRSRDGGTTWQRLTASASHAAFGVGETLHAIVDGRVTSTDDGGKTWTPAAELPFTPQQVLAGRERGTFVVFGARHARTTDGGATFTLGPEKKASYRHQAALAHPSGRWFFVPADGEYIQFSDDEGITWTAAADEQPQTIVTDPSHPRAIYLTSWDKLAHLTW